MPQLVAFKRTWNIGSDDFVFSGAVDVIIRSIWLVVVVAVYAHYNDELGESCHSGDLLHVYFIGLLVFLVITIIIAVLMVYISMQGTISNSEPRKRLPIVIYIRLGVAVPEVVWNALGTRWAFSSEDTCHDNIVGVAKGTVIIGWLLLLFAIISLIILFNPFNNKSKGKKQRVRSFKRASRRTFSTSTAKQWEKRCKCMFMCAMGDDRSAGVFATLAQLSADYFKGVDLVPTDVLAGLVLLSRKQERKRQQLQIVTSEGTDKRYHGMKEKTRNVQRPLEDIPDSTTNVIHDIILECQTRPGDWMTLESMSHYLKYAIGSYGWPFYVTLVKPVIGICALCPACRCCACSDDQGSIYMDNCCMCNTAAFRKTTGVAHDDIVYASFQNGICEIPFYVVIDRTTKSVVVAIRGTLSLQDVITDLVIDRGEVKIEGISKAHAHAGILESAKYVKDTLEEKHILEDAFSRAEKADLVLTGHSLGAGVAALLAILLKPTYPNLKCFAFSPPGELISPNVRDYTLDIVCTVILGDDIITRQGMLMMDDLKMQILQALSETKRPKYHILMSGCWRMCCGRSGLLDETTEGTNKDPADSRQDDNIKVRVANRSSLNISLEECKAHSRIIKDSYHPLQLPGQILHIENSHLSGDEDYIASWKRPEDFTEIIVSPDMLSHHFPDALLDAIDELRNKNFQVDYPSSQGEFTET